MVELQQINKSSNITIYRAKDKQSVRQMVQRLNLESKYFDLLINGSKVTRMEQLIGENDSIVVLPKIDGG